MSCPSFDCMLNERVMVDKLSSKGSASCMEAHCANHVDFSTFLNGDTQSISREGGSEPNV